MKIKVDYQNNFEMEKIINKLKKIITKDTVIVNIGTDRCVGDSVAPMLGTMLKDQKFPLTVYGTLDEPIHAINIREKIQKIHIRHPNSMIIGIDACLGNKEDVGKIILRDSPIKPGKGVGKSLPDVGDYSIAIVVDEATTNAPLTRRNIRLSFIRNLAESVSLILNEALNIGCASDIKLTIKELKDFIQDLNDNTEVVIESIVKGEDLYCSEVQDIYFSENCNSGEKLLILSPKEISI
ncbi:spore protease YyaC [Clostridium botulinum]|uniref:spore protease YyaC n=1 Tax=Clostridium botulinum TaxID=1491 RepID=UPI001E659A10|nr:spore protease YyaC [Clostridium botulinum]MCD3276703.1 spore protease YyaC [Clostridium botulinum C/D]MCD3288272.1 spore protease YyaC [Clostridium botulinum C/D]MCD3290811.1 spore protease YyaC [Clostridium botulinum C/D]MCD3303795.1 spore protease YyaC [Clostridium botulinum C/D]